MSSHKPTLQDAAADLYRCVYFSIQNNGFESTNFDRFLSNAENILSDYQSIKVERVKDLIKRSKDSSKELIKRQEDLLTASLLLK